MVCFQSTRPAEAISSRAPMAAALIRTGFVMETTTVQIMEMKMDVVRDSD